MRMLDWFSFPQNILWPLLWDVLDVLMLPRLGQSANQQTKKHSRAVLQKPCHLGEQGILKGVQTNLCVPVGWAPLHLIPGCCTSGGSGSTCRSKEKAAVSSLCSLPQVPATSLVTAHVNFGEEKKKKPPLVHLIPK